MIIKKFVTGLATAALLGSATLPTAFAADVVVSGNGSGSTNKVEIENEKEVKVEQSNVTLVGTFVYAEANSGGNKNEGNTGGSNSIDAGKSSNAVYVNVEGGDNKVNLPEGCGCEETDTVKVKNNGSRSYNKVEIENENETKVEQHSFTGVLTAAALGSNSGGNKNKNNTGKKHSSNTITTKKATNVVAVNVETGDNKVW